MVCGFGGGRLCCLPALPAFSAQSLKIRRLDASACRPYAGVRGQGRRQRAGSSKNRLPKACADTPDITDTGGNAALRGICQNAPRVYPNDLLLTINLIESVVLGVQVLPVTPAEIASSFAKIRRWLALPYSSYCQRFAALSCGNVEL